MAAALDAAVRPGTTVEIGYAPLELTEQGHRSPLEPIGSTPVLHWHGDRFETPAGAVDLARTASTPHQAFSLGDHVLALQFHLEAGPAMVEQWLIGHTHELSAHGIDPRNVRRDAQAFGPELAARAATVFSTWLNGLERRG